MNDDLEKIIEESASHMNEVINFGQELIEKSRGTIKPAMHQAIRMYEAVENGRKRMIFEDATSGGKTFTAVGIKSLTDKKMQRNSKALVIGPSQAIASAWNTRELLTYTSALGLSAQTSIKLDEEDNIEELLKRDFVLVNFDKLSRLDREGYTNEHYRKIMKLLPFIDTIIVDEAHNLKNIEANRTRRFTGIVEGTMDKNFLILTASAVPNRLKDAGFILYMLDPKKYKHYATSPFDYTEDPYSIRNARNSGAWFRFVREDLKKLFGLPELKFGDEELEIEKVHKFEMSEEAANEYFNIWSSNQNLSKTSALSQVLLRSEIGELERLCTRIREKKPSAQIAIYSFHKAGFSEQLVETLKENFRVGLITGEDPEGSDTNEKVDKRLSIAKNFRNGDLDVLVNTISTVSESISLTTDNRPAYIIFAEPPIVPANFEQAIGRVYRIGQKGEVYVIEVSPQKGWLVEKMQNEKEKLENSIRFRDSWKSAILFDCKRAQRQDKGGAIEKACNAALLDDIESVAADLTEESEVGNYPTIQNAEALAQQKSPNHRFNDWLKPVRNSTGRGVEHLIGNPNFKYLTEAYFMLDWDKTSSADTNRAIAQTIDVIEQKTGQKLEKILDWGCGPACLARISGRRIYNLDASREMLEKGIEICKTLGIYDPAKIEEFFKMGDAKQMPFPNEFFDLVSSSYALQYNAQGTKGKRDVEQILLETNRVLKDGGLGIFGLPNQTAKKEDVDALRYLLPKYGFEILYGKNDGESTVTGHLKDGRNIFQGYHMLLYAKKENAGSYTDGGERIYICPPVALVGIGGIKVERKKAGMHPEEQRNKEQEAHVSEMFKNAADLSLQSGIADALRNYRK